MAKLGVTTTTGDAEGAIVKVCPHSRFSKSTLEAVCDSFKGVISQLPPMYSALKHQGQPLYKWARKGVVIARARRQVTVYRLELQEYKDDWLTLLVECSKGTYIRTLLEDLGQALGCGAHVVGLRRRTLAHFHEHEMVALSTLESLAQADGPGCVAMKPYLLPVEASVQWMPAAYCSASAVHDLRQGRTVVATKINLSNNLERDWIRICLENEQFIGMGQIQEDGRIAPRRLLQSMETANEGV